MIDWTRPSGAPAPYALVVVALALAAGILIGTSIPGDEIDVVLVEGIPPAPGCNCGA